MQDKIKLTIDAYNKKNFAQTSVWAFFCSGCHTFTRNPIQIQPIERDSCICMEYKVEMVSYFIKKRELQISRKGEIIMFERLWEKSTNITKLMG